MEKQYLDNGRTPNQTPNRSDSENPPDAIHQIGVILLLIILFRVLTHLL